MINLLFKEAIVGVGEKKTQGKEFCSIAVEEIVTESVNSGIADAYIVSVGRSGLSGTA